jgi:hypothetical protein
MNNLFDELDKLHETFPELNESVGGYDYEITLDDVKKIVGKRVPGKFTNAEEADNFVWEEIKKKEKQLSKEYSDILTPGFEEIDKWLKGLDYSSGVEGKRQTWSPTRSKGKSDQALNKFFSAVIEFYTGRNVGDVEYVQDPKVDDTYAVRCKIQRGKKQDVTDWLFIHINDFSLEPENLEHIAFSMVEEADFETWPPKSGELRGIFGV